MVKRHLASVDEMPGCCAEIAQRPDQIGVFVCPNCEARWRAAAKTDEGDVIWWEQANLPLYAPSPETSEERLRLHGLIDDLALAAHGAVDAEKNVAKGDDWVAEGPMWLSGRAWKEMIELEEEINRGDAVRALAEGGDALAFLAMCIDCLRRENEG